MQRFDELDKYLSGPIFRAIVPASVEFIWSIPGNFFGIPLFALLLSPNLVALFLAENQSNYNALLVVSIILLVLVLLWTLVLQGNKAAIKIVYGPILGAVAPLVGITLLMFLQEEEDRAPGFFQIAAWCLSVTPVAILKPLVARTRPCCSPGCSEHAKHMVILPQLFQRDGRASFPSGDTAGVMAVSYPLIRCGGTTGVLIGTVCIVLSFLGRMYWKAHHFSDVSVGVFIAFVCCYALEWTIESPCGAELWHAGAAYGFLLTNVILSRLYFRTKIFQSGTISTHDEEGKKH
mmetsp:Transcript_19198/g.31882  ORF Transcript_19198/g.31882 Transcript_19198/m.31882 type:complete len:291 (+) Transcript_19198:165-1037(+)